MRTTESIKEIYGEVVGVKQVPIPVWYECKDSQGIQNIYFEIYFVKGVRIHRLLSLGNSVITGDSIYALYFPLEKREISYKDAIRKTGIEEMLLRKDCRGDAPEGTLYVDGIITKIKDIYTPAPASKPVFLTRERQ